jgi:copper(I)-binding protein
VRTPLPAVVAGVAALAVGGAGVVRGEMPQAAPAAPSASTSVAAPIVVGGAYVRQPVPGSRTAAAYFTVYNTTGKADRLVAVTSGVGATAVLHAYVHGRMTAARDGVVIGPHRSLTLSTGKGHVMIQQLYGALRVGSSVDLELTFSRAGTIDVTAPVIGLTAVPPTGGPSSPSSSGAGS